MTEVDVDAELRFFTQNCTPRRPEAMQGGHGIKVLRSFLTMYNSSIASSQSDMCYQGSFSGIARNAACCAEYEFAMGFPIDRMRFFLRQSAVGMLECLRLRGTLETVEFTTERQPEPTGEMGPERLVDAKASVDVSLGHPGAGINAVYSAWLALDTALAVQVANAICFDPYDTECNGEEAVAEMRANVALLRDNPAGAEKWLRGTRQASFRAQLLTGIHAKQQGVFDAGMQGLLKHLEKHERRLRGGKKDIPPQMYWSIEAMGAALLGMKHGLSLRIEHPFIPKEMLNGCV